VKLQTDNRNPSTKNETEHNQDTITIRYIPLPSDKRAAWERSMRILTALILEIVEEERQTIIESIFERIEYER